MVLLSFPYINHSFQITFSLVEVKRALFDQLLDPCQRWQGFVWTRCRFHGFVWPDRGGRVSGLPRRIVGSMFGHGICGRGFAPSSCK